jgi:uncharacterized surface protein with fasciclin (FAS1) repeats
MRKLAVVLALLALAIGLVVPAFAQERPDIPTLLANDGRFTTLLAAVEAADLVDALSGEGPLTVFAPSDEAFATALEALGMTPEDVMADPDLLAQVLTYHVVPGRYFFRQLTGGPELETLQGETVQIDLTDGVFTINGVNISDVDNVASNGIVHVIDGVILPTAVTAAMTPPEPTEAPPEPTEAPSGQAAVRPSISETLATDERFSTLASLVEAAGLTETLNSGGPFTVLAPTNEAVDAALAFLGVTADDLLANPEGLAQVLNYHVIPQRQLFRNLIRGAVLESVNGASVAFIEGPGGFLTANGATISDVDNVAGNGVIHVIDSVLIPPGVFPAAHVRVAHFSPDAPAVDVYINGDLSDIQGAEFGAITDWVEVTPNPALNVAVSAAGTSLADAVIGPVALSLAPGSWTTIAAVGSVEGGTLTAATVDEDYSEIAADTARVTVFHAIEGAPAVNVLANGSTLIVDLGFPGTLDGNDGAFTVNVPAGTYNLAVNAGGAPILTLDGAELVAGTNYFIAAIGTADNPSLLVQPTDQSS